MKKPKKDKIQSNLEEYFKMIPLMQIYIGHKLKCIKCKMTFGLDSDYIGVVTCPYCGELVEQP